MNLTFYVVVIAFIFALFYLCSRESPDDEEVPSTGAGEDCEMRTPYCNVDIHQESANLGQTVPLRLPPEPANQAVPPNLCPPSYEQVIRNEEFYSMNQTKNQQQHHQLGQ